MKSTKHAFLFLATKTQAEEAVRSTQYGKYYLTLQPHWQQAVLPALLDLANPLAAISTVSISGP